MDWILSLTPLSPTYNSFHASKQRSFHNSSAIPQRSLICMRKIRVKFQSRIEKLLTEILGENVRLGCESMRFWNCTYIVFATAPSGVITEVFMNIEIKITQQSNQ